MKIIHVASFREFAEAGLKPYRSAQQPWNFLLQNDQGQFGFSLNQTQPTAWTEPCENGCKDGWHQAKCIQDFRAKMNEN